MLDGVKTAPETRLGLPLPEKALFMPGERPDRAAAKTACASGDRAAILRAVDDLKLSASPTTSWADGSTAAGACWRRSRAGSRATILRIWVARTPPPGLVLDTSEKLPIQAFDVARSAVANGITAWGCTVRVSGGFRGARTGGAPCSSTIWRSSGRATSGSSRRAGPC